MTPRLKIGIYVKALIRRAEVAGASAYVLRHGADEAGALYLKVVQPDGCFTVLSQARRGEGELVWIKPLGETSDEGATARYFEKQIRFDPDLWIVEIEDRAGRPFVDEPIA